MLYGFSMKSWGTSEISAIIWCQSLKEIVSRFCSQSPRRNTLWEKSPAVFVSCLAKIKFDVTTLFNCFRKVYEAISDRNKEHWKKNPSTKQKEGYIPWKNPVHSETQCLWLSHVSLENLIVNLLERLKLQTLGNIWKEWREEVYEFGHLLHKQAAYPQATNSFFLCFLWTTEYLITVYEAEWLQWKESIQPQKSLPDDA